MYHNIDYEEHGDNIFQTSLYNRVVDWYILIHEWEHFYSEMNYRRLKYWQWVYAKPQYHCWFWMSQYVSLDCMID